MKRNRNIGFLAVSAALGFMLAVQYKTVAEPEQRDTRDIWELKADIREEQKLHGQLLQESNKADQQLAKYESDRQVSKEKLLEETLGELKADAGFTDKTGQGVILSIEPLPEELLSEETAGPIPATLLKRLINELNTYEATDVSINGNRVINTTVIREVNGATKIDGTELSSFPIEVKVLSDNPERLKDKLKVSQAIEEFFIENYSLSVSEVQSSIRLPAYSSQIRIEHMERDMEEEGGGS